MPLGFTQVMAVDCGMPKSLAIFLLVSTATVLNISKLDSRLLLSGAKTGQSSMPVKDTPSSLSSSVLSFHTLRKYLKSVSVD